MCPVLPVSLDCQFLIGPSVFSMVFISLFRSNYLTTIKDITSKSIEILLKALNTIHWDTTESSQHNPLRYYWKLSTQSIEILLKALNTIHWDTTESSQHNPLRYYWKLSTQSIEILLKALNTIHWDTTESSQHNPLRYYWKLSTQNKKFNAHFKYAKFQNLEPF